MLIGLMFLPNHMVFTQFHPVAYMVKLNIEMTMASLIRRISLAFISQPEAVSRPIRSEAAIAGHSPVVLLLERMGGLDGNHASSHPDAPSPLG